MSIQIIRQTPLQMTAAQLFRLRAEYDKAFIFYSGTPPDFETWAREMVANSPRIEISGGTGK